MSAIAKAVWIIESRFAGELPLDDIATHSGVSRSHLSRSFLLTTGISISSYMRGRRLTEAARSLANGAPDILFVALDAGYGSHEAFTRAFRDQFGTTPEEVRSRRSVATLKLTEPIRMNETATIALAPPRFDDHSSFLVAGIMQRHEIATGAAIPAQWQRFGPYIGNIPGQIGMAAYGVCGEVFEDQGEFDYLCGVEVRDAADVPPELDVLKIPAQRFACFTHQGHITAIRSTFHAVFTDWLPKSGLEVADGYNCLEYYGPDFDPVTGYGTVEVWLAIKR